MQSQMMMGMGSGMGFSAMGMGATNNRAGQSGQPYMSVQEADPNLRYVGGAQIRFE